MYRTITNPFFVPPLILSYAFKGDSSTRFTGMFLVSFDRSEVAPNVACSFAF
jgi:hypothetical protein